MPGRVLIIAGSDSGGGAGIQADIKAVSALDGFAMTAITALTAQNTEGVHGIYPVPVQFIDQQIQVVLSDIGADCIKIGMLHDEHVIQTVVSTIKHVCAHIPIVIDPVMVAKGGSRLLASEAVSTLKEQLIPLATLLTPNIPECEALTGIEATNEIALQNIGEKLLKIGAQAVLLKGGHLKGSTIKDYLFTVEGVEVFQNSRIDTAHTHGTGCTLASAIAAGFAIGLNVSEAVKRAEQYLHKAIAGAPGYGHGKGPIDHMHTVRIKN